MPKKKTLLSLNKKEILQLPGFTHLNNYLLKELKNFVRTRMHEYTTKKRGYTGEEYINDYNKKPEKFEPKYKTESKLIRNRETKEATDKLLVRLENKRTKRNYEEYKLKHIENRILPPPDTISFHSSSPPSRKIRNIASIEVDDYDTLNDGQELDDTVINAYININNNKRHDIRKIAYEYTFIMEHLENKAYDLVLDYEDFKGKNLDDYDYIIFPIHFHRANAKDKNKGAHWILCIIDMRKSKIKIYDSMQQGYKYTRQTNLIKNLLKRAKILRKFTVEYLKGPKQNSGSDCGVFVSEYAKRFLLNEPINFKQSDIKQIRNNMKNVLKPYVKKK